MIIDPSSSVGKVRMRTGDWRDIPILEDIVIEQALLDCNNDVKAASVLCCQYILATLAFKSHQKLSMIEVWGRESYLSYRDYVMTVLKNPDFSGISPLPFTQLSCPSPIARFQKNWDKQYDCSIYAGCCDPDPCGGCP